MQVRRLLRALLIAAYPEWTCYEYFLYLFQPLKDKNVCAPLPNLLNDIIDCLETMPGTGSMEVSIVLSFHKTDLGTGITMSWSCFGSQIFYPGILQRR